MQKRLRIYLEAHGVKATWIAVTTHIDYDRILRIMNGTEPEPAEALAIAASLRKPVEELFQIVRVGNPLIVP